MPRSITRENASRESERFREGAEISAFGPVVKGLMQKQTRRPGVERPGRLNVARDGPGLC